jgi:hypothetical protein
MANFETGDDLSRNQQVETPQFSTDTTDVSENQSVKLAQQKQSEITNKAGVLPIITVCDDNVTHEKSAPPERIEPMRDRPLLTRKPAEAENPRRPVVDRPMPVEPDDGLTGPREKPSVVPAKPPARVLGSEIGPPSRKN